jgi:V/A-type H+-transporting ATPase subunit C
MYYKNIRFAENNRYVFEASLANSMRLQLFSINEYERFSEQDLDTILSAMAERKYEVSLKDLDQILGKAEETLIQTVARFSKNPLLEEYFRLPYDFFNLKTLFKGWLKEEEFEKLKLYPYGVLSRERLERLYRNEEAGVLPPALQQAIKKFNEKISTRSPFEVDTLWDGFLHEFYLRQSGKLKNDFMTKFHSLKIDLKNLMNLFRLKSFDKDYKVFDRIFIPGGKLDIYTLSDLFKEDLEIIIGKLAYLDYAENLKRGLEHYRKENTLSDMERELENYVLEFLELAGNRIFGYEVIVAYYWLKKNEIDNLRLLVTAKANSISKELILSRLRIR